MVFFLSTSALTCLGQDQVIDLQDLSVSIPKTWERVPDDKTILTARGPSRGANDAFSENIRIEVRELPRPATPEQILAAQTSTKALGKYRLLGQGKVDEAKTPVVWYAITHTEAAKNDRVIIDYVAVKGQKAFVMHCMIEADQWKAEQKVFEKIAKSLTFK